MSVETAQNTCMVCMALKSVAHLPGDDAVRESRAFMLGYVAGLVHSLGTREPDELAKLSLEGACFEHSLQLVQYTQSVLTAFVKEKTP